MNSTIFHRISFFPAWIFNSSIFWILRADFRQERKLIFRLYCNTIFFIQEKEVKFTAFCQIVAMKCLYLTLILYLANFIRLVLGTYFYIIKYFIPFTAWKKPFLNICYLLMTSGNKRRYLDHFSNRNCSLPQKWILNTTGYPR